MSKILDHSKRLIAGALAALLVLTALPETALDVYAAQDNADVEEYDHFEPDYIEPVGDTDPDPNPGPDYVEPVGENAPTVNVTWNLTNCSLDESSVSGATKTGDELSSVWTVDQSGDEGSKVNASSISFTLTPYDNYTLDGVTVSATIGETEAYVSVDEGTYTVKYSDSENPEPINDAVVISATAVSDYELTVTIDGQAPSDTSKATPVVMIGEDQVAEETEGSGKYTIPVGSTVTVSAESVNDYKFAVKEYQIGETENQSYSAPVSFAISGDTTIAFTTEDLAYVSYKFPDDEVTIADSEAVTVSDMTADLVYSVGDTPMEIAGDYSVTVGETVLDDETTPKLSDFVMPAEDNKTLVVDFSKIAASNTEQSVVVKIGGVAEGSELEQKAVTFTIPAIVKVTFVTADPDSLSMSYTEYNGNTPVGDEVQFTLNASDDDESYTAIVSPGNSIRIKGFVVGEPGMIKIISGVGNVTKWDAVYDEEDYSTYYVSPQLSADATVTVTAGGMPASDITLPESGPNMAIRSISVTSPVFRYENTDYLYPSADYTFTLYPVRGITVSSVSYSIGDGEPVVIESISNTSYTYSIPSGSICDAIRQGAGIAVTAVLDGYAYDQTFKPLYVVADNSGLGDNASFDVTVYDPSGREVGRKTGLSVEGLEHGIMVPQGGRVTFSTPTGLPAGAYFVGFKVISSSGNKISKISVGQDGSYTVYNIYGDTEVTASYTVYPVNQGTNDFISLGTGQYRGNVIFTGGIYSTEAEPHSGLYVIGEDLEFRLVDLDALSASDIKSVSYKVKGGSEVVLTATDGVYKIPKTVLADAAGSGKDVIIKLNEEADVNLTVTVNGKTPDYSTVTRNEIMLYSADGKFTVKKGNIVSIEASIRDLYYGVAVFEGATEKKGTSGTTAITGLSGPSIPSYTATESAVINFITSDLSYKYNGYENRIPGNVASDKVLVAPRTKATLKYEYNGSVQSITPTVRVGETVNTSVASLNSKNGVLTLDFSKVDTTNGEVDVTVEYAEDTAKGFSAKSMVFTVAKDESYDIEIRADGNPAGSSTAIKSISVKNNSTGKTVKPVNGKYSIACGSEITVTPVMKDKSAAAFDSVVIGSNAYLPIGGAFVYTVTGSATLDVHSSSLSYSTTVNGKTTTKTVAGTGQIVAAKVGGAFGIQYTLAGAAQPLTVADVSIYEDGYPVDSPDYVTASSTGIAITIPGDAYGKVIRLEVNGPDGTATKELRFQVADMKYESSLKLSRLSSLPAGVPGKVAPSKLYTTDDNWYVLAIPVWSKSTTPAAREIWGFSATAPDGRYCEDALKYQNGVFSFNPSAAGKYAKGKWTITATAKGRDGAQSSATLKVNVLQGIHGLYVIPKSSHIYKAQGKTATLRTSVEYRDEDTNVKYEPATKALTWYATSNGNRTGDLASRGITVNNGTVTMAADSTYTGFFFVVAEAADCPSHISAVSTDSITVVDAEPVISKVSLYYSDFEIKADNSSSGPAKSIFGDWIVVKKNMQAADTLVVESGDKDVTDCFTVSASGVVKYDKGMLIWNGKAGEAAITLKGKFGEKKTHNYKFTVTAPSDAVLGYNVESFGNFEINGSGGLYVNPAPEDVTIKLTVSDIMNENAIDHKISVKGGKLANTRKLSDRSVYLITPSAHETVVTITDNTRKTGNETKVTVTNSAIADSKTVKTTAKVTAYNNNPIKKPDSKDRNNKGKIYNSLLYPTVTTEFAKSYEDAGSPNLVTYTVTGGRAGDIVLITDVNGIFENTYNYLSVKNEHLVCVDQTANIYATTLKSGGRFTIDYSYPYTIGENDYMNFYVPKGTYSLKITAGNGSLSDGDLAYFTATAKTATVKVKAVTPPTPKVTVNTKVTFANGSGMAKLSINKKKTTNIVYGTDVVFNNPTRSVNSNGTINRFAQDYQVVSVNPSDYRLLFTGYGSRGLLNSDNWISSKTATKNNMLTGYVPVSYQTASGGITQKYVKVTVKASKGLTAIMY